ncbi:energy-coupling factor transport system ATP-binding protein [Symbiobacterium terraclitae]|uniref:Energy-coupling factor transport system ATP-binding protein n=1 Tax=Symbiobacterium terraclitae TaxID=557451 RepID=A0ABS4JWN8_9FIRM|nr:energy-coupling factor transport system ATP-binding protein [Symbiobacterium terraclitae]
MQLRLEQVSFAYRRGMPVLQEINVALAGGEFVALAGRSGSGKSTLVQVMKGLIRPDAGRISLDGEAAADGLFDAVGLVFQYPEHQLFARSVYDDIAFGPRRQGLAELQVEERVLNAMAAMALDPVRYREASPFELSGGEKRRVAIAGVIALEPRWLLLDEPTAGLDARGRKALFTLLERLRHERGVGVLVVTHRLEEVLPCATRLVIMQAGRIAADGEPLALLADESRVRQMGLEPLEAIQLRQRLLALGWPALDAPWDVDRTAEALLAYRRGRGGR